MRALPLALFISIASVPAAAGRAYGQEAPPAYSGAIVVFVGPDSAGLERLRKKVGDEDFHVIADDEMWYRANAFELLDGLRVPYALVDRGVMRFVVRGTPREYAWEDVDREWFVVIYDGASEPRISSSVDLGNDLGPLRPRARAP
jgi:hypothetical protein